MLREVKVNGAVAYVPLTQGYVAVVDAEDVPLVQSWNWTASVKPRSDKSIRAVYAIRVDITGPKRRTVFMHRVIMATPSGLQVDHIDGDGLNNRRSNLREATAAENSRNRRAKIGSAAGVKGVSFHKPMGKWVAQIGVNGKSHHLGYFADIDQAAAAYATASAKLHGAFGRAK